MPSPADLTNPTFRDALTRIEALIDDGDYTTAAKTAGETYLKVLEAHPDLIAGASTGPHTPTNMSRAIAWPPSGGLTVRVDDGAPTLVYTRERFSMSEALGYFEFLMNLLWTLQKGEA
jgi:hypothetical protein